MFLGTIINAVAVAAGSLLGMFLKKSFPAHIREILYQGLGLCTLTIGFTMILKTENVLLLIFSIILGGITGEILRLEKHINRFGEFVKKKLKSKNDMFTEGLVTSFLIFCVGSMTIMGAIDAGVRGNHTILLTKSILDGFASIALAVTYGGGVFFSSLALLIYQGVLILLGVWLQNYFTLVMIHQLTAAGGILILGIGINLLNLRTPKINTTNLLPSLVYVVLLSLIFH